MARYTSIDTHPRLLAVDLSRPLLSGTFEHVLTHLLDHAIDRSHFDARVQHDATGAPASPPALLRTVVLCASSQGIGSRRQIERVCQDHVTFIVGCGDRARPGTTMAQLVGTLGEAIARVFAAVLAVCDAQGLIGREMFASDGVKVPSNASTHRRGTHAAFARQAEQRAAAATTMGQRHRAAEPASTESAPDTKASKRVAKLERDAAQIRTWLAPHPEERRGVTGARRKRHRTDPERANMATSNGVLPGDTGVAAVDRAQQIIVNAPAHGTGSEQALLLPVVHAVPALRATDTRITADAG